MIKTIFIGMFFLIAISVSADDVLTEFHWTDLQKNGQLSAGKLEGKSLKLINMENSTKTFKIITLKDPGITAPAYAIAGRIRYTNVEKAGYLEMWSYLPEDKAFFSRTLATSGPLQNIRGSSEWREFQLPFYLKDESGWLDVRPKRIAFNIVLPGKGTVYLESVKLLQYPQSGQGVQNGWWGSSAAGYTGTVGGVICGLLGALVGGLLSAGKGRKVISFTLILMLGAGIACLIAGGVAAIQKQPYSVLAPLFILGVISTVVSAGLMPTVRKRFEADELRRISAMDAS